MKFKDTATLPNDIMFVLEKNGILSKKETGLLREIKQLKNYAVHGYAVEVKEAEALEYLRIASAIERKVQDSY